MHEEIHRTKDLCWRACETVRRNEKEAYVTLPQWFNSICQFAKT